MPYIGYATRIESPTKLLFFPQIYSILLLFSFIRHFLESVSPCSAFIIKNDLKGARKYIKW